MFPADFLLGDLYCRCSFGARPCRELGRMCPELAGELGTLELGELLCEEFPAAKKKYRHNFTIKYSFQNVHVYYKIRVKTIASEHFPTVVGIKRDK